MWTLSLLFWRVGWLFSSLRSMLSAFTFRYKLISIDRTRLNPMKIDVGLDDLAFRGCSVAANCNGDLLPIFLEGALHCGTSHLFTGCLVSCVLSVKPLPRNNCCSFLFVKHIPDYASSECFTSFFFSKCLPNKITLFHIIIRGDNLQITNSADHSVSRSRSLQITQSSKSTFHAFSMQMKTRASEDLN